MNIRCFFKHIEHFGYLAITSYSLLYIAGFYMSFRVIESSKKFLPDYEIYLEKSVVHSKEEIIDIGRKAIRDKNTNTILVNPHVGEDGYSYNGKKEEPYENRLLKQVIEALYEIE